MDNSGGNRGRLPLPYGGDQRPIGRMDFASFAMPTMPRHRSGPGATANRPGDVADFSRWRALRLAIRRPELILKIFFCDHQAQDLRQIRRPRNLTTCQSAAKLAVWLGMRSQPILGSRYTRRRNATNLPRRACANHRLCDIGKANRRARFMRDGALRIGGPQRANTMVDQQALERELGF
jgi:hypothetical protein